MNNDELLTELRRLRDASIASGKAETEHHWRAYDAGKVRAYQSVIELLEETEQKS